jgi:hypothetical protein
MSKFKGVWIPAEIWNLMVSGDLSVREVQLLSIIRNLEESKNGCFASNEYFAKVLAVSQVYISRMIKNLKQRGFIEQVKFDGRRRHIRTLSVVPDMNRTSHVNNQPVLNNQFNSELNSSATLSSPTGKINKKAYAATPSFGFDFCEIPDEVYPFDYECCQRLLEYLPAKKRKRSVPKSWPNQIRLMRESDQIEEDQITMALDWYAKNHTDQWTPKCHTAKSFRDKFHRLLDAIDRTKSDSKPDVVISEEAKKITERLLTKNWPGDCDDNLIGYVQISLDAYDLFRSKVHNLFKEVSSDELSERVERMKNDRFKSLLNHVIESLPQTSHFVEKWFESVWSRIVNWPDWSGKLQPFVFRIDSPVFTKQLGQIFSDYGRQSTEVHKFIRRLHESDESNKT